MEEQKKKNRYVEYFIKYVFLLNSNETHSWAYYSWLRIVIQNLECIILDPSGFKGFCWKPWCNSESPATRLILFFSLTTFSFFYFLIFMIFYDNILSIFLCQILFLSLYFHICTPVIHRCYSPSLVFGKFLPRFSNECDLCCVSLFLFVPSEGWVFSHWSSALQIYLYISSLIHHRP